MFVLTHVLWTMWGMTCADSTYSYLCHNSFLNSRLNINKGSRYICQHNLLRSDKVRCCIRPCYRQVRRSLGRRETIETEAFLQNNDAALFCWGWWRGVWALCYCYFRLQKFNDNSTRYTLLSYLSDLSLTCPTNFSPQHPVISLQFYRNIPLTLDLWPLLLPWLLLLPYMQYQQPQGK